MGVDATLVGTDGGQSAPPLLEGYHFTVVTVRGKSLVDGRIVPETYK